MIYGMVSTDERDKSRIHWAWEVSVTLAWKRAYKPHPKLADMQMVFPNLFKAYKGLAIALFMEGMSMIYTLLFHRPTSRTYHNPKDAPITLVGSNSPDRKPNGAKCPVQLPLFERRSQSISASVVIQSGRSGNIESRF